MLALHLAVRGYEVNQPVLHNTRECAEGSSVHGDPVSGWRPIAIVAPAVTLLAAGWALSLDLIC